MPAQGEALRRLHNLDVPQSPRAWPSSPGLKRSHRKGKVRTVIILDEVNMCALLLLLLLLLLNMPHRSGYPHLSSAPLVPLPRQQLLLLWLRRRRRLCRWPHSSCRPRLTRRWHLLPSRGKNRRLVRLLYGTSLRLGAQQLLLLLRLLFRLLRKSADDGALAGVRPAVGCAVRHGQGQPCDLGAPRVHGRVSGLQGGIGTSQHDARMPSTGQSVTI